MSMLHNVAKSHTNQSIRNLLKVHFVNIKHIKIRWYFDQCFVSPEYSGTIIIVKGDCDTLHGFDMKPSFVTH